MNTTGQERKTEVSNSGYRHPQTVEELTQQNIDAVLQIEQKAKQGLTRADHIAEKIASFCGTMPFIWVHIVWFAAWVIANIVPGIRHFDPYPFTFLSFCVSLEAIFLTTFVLISQNHETRLSDRRNHLDLQINLLTEQEITKILTMLKQIADKMGADVGGDPELKILEQSTRPDKLVEQIEKSIEMTETAETQTPST